MHFQIDAEFLIQTFGTFSIPLAKFQAFQVLGSFINGQDAILFKWAEFSVQASSKSLTVNQVLDEVLKSPITTREISESKPLYQTILQTEGKVYCVWSGKQVNRYDIDRIIPFSIWKNNDLWNLLPAQPELNNQKRDKVPAIDLIDQQQELITHYWKILSAARQQRFQKELQIALLGYSQSGDWQQQAFNQLKESCAYLINVRGFDSWLPR
ncbi:HNH endonuclease [Mucilaginibacter frigoritolerans]|uniref:HNH endonuclease n=1 Tax=Mucilaginibacter frigoritolerans TaxID=652788 RepID=A0A562UBW5_9SPHI|nr:HNH endonuclease domain-containing protein [Mucilaginibacter frigoritolerans]TWJ03293.1 HNH endonuclease [Mucilaginibacter frigoritolerans]